MRLVKKRKCRNVIHYIRAGKRQNITRNVTGCFAKSCITFGVLPTQIASFGHTPSTAPLSGSVPVLFPDCIRDFVPDIIPEMNPFLHRDSFPGSNPDFY
ncbi:hypothetical protein CH330_05385 [candidate division WOR-3 bacterium JGI_Cruoil_03_51_56]|uniref:Uncharacterized protein n=1 Tax=candidate division WOR-3 bacterium JGI_Cruoil_03_51_56 TaxID=1973747 RepID=A0A235BSU1_UNCW3|nr:MAG: hypothetical protein CH330_05385 [candidate division WOR-3 bacterium JGI_Cruoil_03_51_56]